MGSYGDVVPLASNVDNVAENGEEITVMVTGFAPFREQNPKNPAWEIARLLPPFLPPAKATDDNPIIPYPRVRILIYPDPIKVAYKSVRELVPKLWDYASGPVDKASASNHASSHGDIIGGIGRKQRVDYMIHIGMASGRKWYSIERRAHRDGYVMKDVDGEILEDDGGVRHEPKQETRTKPVVQERAGGVIVAGGRGREIVSADGGGKPLGSITTSEDGIGRHEGAVDSTKTEIQKDLSEPVNVGSRNEVNTATGAKAQSLFTDDPSQKDKAPDAIEVGNLKEPWIWEGLPKEILTDIDVDDVWKRWRIALPNADARISEDPGRYLCDFIYYSSLAELTKRKEDKRVLFLHVPVDVDEQSIKTGVEVTCELIRGIVNSGKKREKVTDGTDSQGEQIVEV